MPALKRQLTQAGAVDAEPKATTRAAAPPSQILFMRCVLTVGDAPEASLPVRGPRAQARQGLPLPLRAATSRAAFLAKKQDGRRFPPHSRCARRKGRFWLKSFIARDAHACSAWRSRRPT